MTGILMRLRAIALLKLSGSAELLTAGLTPSLLHRHRIRALSDPPASVIICATMKTVRKYIIQTKGSLVGGLRSRHP